MSNETTNTVFGKRLRDRRVELGLSQKEVAEKVGTTKATISRYETSARQARLSFEQYRLFASVLKCDPLWLANLSDDKTGIASAISHVEVASADYPVIREYCGLSEADKHLVATLIGELARRSVN